MRKVEITSFKANLGFTVARIDLIFNKFSSKVKRHCNYKILVLHYILFAAQKEEMAENNYPLAKFQYQEVSCIPHRCIVKIHVHRANTSIPVTSTFPDDTYCNNC